MNGACAEGEDGAPPTGAVAIAQGVAPGTTSKSCPSPMAKGCLAGLWEDKITEQLGEDKITEQRQALWARLDRVRPTRV